MCLFSFFLPLLPSSGRKSVSQSLFTYKYTLAHMLITNIICLSTKHISKTNEDHNGNIRPQKQNKNMSDLLEVMGCII